MVSWRASIHRIRSLWRKETAAAELVFSIAALLSSTVTAMLIARLGHARSQWAAFIILIATLLALLVYVRTIRRRRTDSQSIVAATVLRTQPDIGRAALRAHRLAIATAENRGRGSADLASLHLLRTLERASLPPIAHRARMRAWLLSVLALLLGGASVLSIAHDPLRMFEGFNLMMARRGTAPIATPWLAKLEVSAKPPGYLELPTRRLKPYFPTALHRGTVITVRAVPLHPNRQLLLSDGAEEVPFHDDGDGHVVAHWTLQQDVALRVVARYGESNIVEPRQLELHSIADLPPRVKLEGAPKVIELLDRDNIPVHYEASDDHGLREVVLVLRSGTHEQRRELARHQGTTREDRGGTALLAKDAFLKRSYLPIEVTVQARDGDPIVGPNWGRSEALLLIPPGVAEREVLRYLALKHAQDEVIDLLALRLKPAGSKPLARLPYLREQETAQSIANEALNAALEQNFGGLWLDGRYALLVRSQMRRLDKALKLARTQPLPVARRSLIDTTESALLAINAAVGSLAYRDSQRSAKQLSEVATDAAQAIALRREPKERARADRHIDAALNILGKAGERLRELGPLGADIGGIVANGLRRIRRALADDDNYHAKLAAEDLAVRLRYPEPSFDSSQGGEAPVEAGGRTGGQDAKPSEATREVAELHRALEQLRQDHAMEISKVQRALQQAVSEEERQQLREQLRDQAKAIRQAIRDLPQEAAQPGSAKATAAQGRSEAEAMAGALEQGDLPRALARGKDAKATLERATRLGRGNSGPAADRETARRAAGARAKLQQSLAEASQLLDAQQKLSSERAQAELEQAATRERELASEASKLRRRNAQSETPLPDDMQRKLGDAVATMRRAAQRLTEKKGSKGLALQKQAQRLLEMAQPESERRPSDGSTAGDGDRFAHHADVPKDSDHQSAEKFRRRVTDGLRRSAPPHLKDAVRRYAEGLLK